MLASTTVEQSTEMVPSVEQSTEMVPSVEPSTEMVPSMPDAPPLVTTTSTTTTTTTEKMPELVPIVVDEPAVAKSSEMSKKVSIGKNAGVAAVQKRM